VQRSESDIPPRDLRFDLDSAPDRAWFGGDVLRTASADSLSLLLPEGERFFIRAVKHYAHRIADPGLQRDIAAFAAQEAFHSREHQAYNQGLRALGYDVDTMEARGRRLLASAPTPYARLLATCALEQITYSFSRHLLSDPDPLAAAQPRYRRLWRWHALEEIEHASVAMRVLAEIGRDLSPWRRYAGRVGMMIVVLTLFYPVVFRNALDMARAAGLGSGPWIRLRLAWIALVRPGFLRASLATALAYCRPFYRHRHAADADMIRRARRSLAEDLAAAARS
jgi:predicted metal-dependent hydrolase